MTRTRAIQLSAITASGTFLATVLAVWAMTQAQSPAAARGGGGGAGGATTVPANVVTTVPVHRSEFDASPSGNLRETNDVRVYKAVKDAVVNITSSGVTTRMVSQQLQGFPFPDMLPKVPMQVQFSSLGTGFVIHSAGYIITNEHVVDQGTDIQCVFFNGDKLSATVIATDNEHDLAVLKVNPLNPLKPMPALELAASEDLMIGEPVYAIGNPLGFAGTMTRGIVSALDRTLDVSKDKSYKGLIQTDASINPGNSGGPLLNAYGQVVGINTAIRADAQGIGFAISVSSMRDLLPAFLNPEALNRAQVGFSVEEVRTITSPSHVTAEVVIKNVQPGTTAEKAGIKAGDRIVSIGGLEVKNIVDALVPIAAAGPGDTLHLVLARGEGKTVIDASMVLAKPPVVPAEEIILAKMGIRGETVTHDLAVRRKLAVDKGIFVSAVEPGSPAANTGIQPGDVLLQLDRYRVNTPEDLATLLKTVKGPVSPAIVILRGTELGRGTISLK